MPRKDPSDSAKKSALESDYTPLYAVAGLTDALAGALRGALADRARKSLNELQNRGAALPQQALTNAEELRTFVITLPEQVRTLPEATLARITELQTQAGDLVAQATATYSELAGRGKLAVDGAVGSARVLSERAEKRAADLREEAGDRVDPLLERAQEGVTQARKTVSGRTATRTVTPRTAAKGTATRTASTKNVGAAKKAAEQAEVIKLAAAERAEPPKPKKAAKKTPAAKKVPVPPAEKTVATEQLATAEPAAAPVQATPAGNGVVDTAVSTS